MANMASCWAKVKGQRETAGRGDQCRGRVFGSLAVTGRVRASLRDRLRGVGGRGTCRSSVSKLLAGMVFTTLTRALRTAGQRRLRGRLSDSFVMVVYCCSSNTLEQSLGHNIY